MAEKLKTFKILPTANNKAYGVRVDPELPDATGDLYKPGDKISVYISKPLMRGFRNRLYVPVRTRNGKDGYIISDAIYRTEG